MTNRINKFNELKVEDLENTFGGRWAKWQYACAAHFLEDTGQTAAHGASMGIAGGPLVATATAIAGAHVGMVAGGIQCLADAYKIGR